MKRIALAGAALALAVPGLATAADGTPSPKQAAKQACQEERTAVRSEVGKSAWKAIYRGNGLGRCIKARRSAEAEHQDNAAKQCKAERADAAFADSHEGKTFDEFYGTNKNKKNAFGKCVSGKAQEASEEDTEARVNAAKTCKEARKDSEAFADAWGTKKNAFGKCVSATAKAQGDSE